MIEYYYDISDENGIITREEAFTNDDNGSWKIATHSINKQKMIEFAQAYCDEINPCVSCIYIENDTEIQFHKEEYMEDD